MPSAFSQVDLESSEKVCLRKNARKGETAMKQRGALPGELPGDQGPPEWLIGFCGQQRENRGGEQGGRWPPLQ
jgi:hypothetical protein